MNVYNLYEVLWTTHGGVNVKTKFKSICDNNMTIMKVVEDMAKSSVDIDNLRGGWGINMTLNFSLYLGIFFLNKLFLKSFQNQK